MNPIQRVFFFSAQMVDKWKFEWLKGIWFFRTLVLFTMRICKLSFDGSRLWNSRIGNTSSCIYMDVWRLASVRFILLKLFSVSDRQNGSASGLVLHNLINKIPMIHPKMNEILPENANKRRTNRACNCQTALEFTFYSLNWVCSSL